MYIQRFFRPFGLRTLWLAGLALGLAWTALPGRGQDVDPRLLDLEAQRIAVIEKAKPAVVAIFARGGQGGGSGVLIDTDGYTLTNYHVVAGQGSALKCGLPDGILYDAVLVGVDKVGDIALVKLLPQTEGKPFPCAVMGDSDKVHAGEWSLAMGNPFLLATDFTPTVTYGLISGIHRYQYPESSRGLLEYTDCIQVDTSINPGNSGGPLFNMQGELIGINGRISLQKRERLNSGVGYAISINQIKNFLGHLRSGLDTDHATTGFAVETEGENEDGASARMAVRTILEDADAHRRGLEPGDELVSFVGRPMTSVNQYKNVLGLFPKGWRVPMVYRRDNDKKEVLVRLMGVQRQTRESDTPARPRQRPQPGPQPDDPQPGPRPRQRPGPDNPQPGPRPRQRPGQPETPQPKDPLEDSPALKLYEAKSGFANYYFNKLARDHLLAASRKQGDFSTLAGDWTIEGELEIKQQKVDCKLSIVEEKDKDGTNTRTLARLNLGGIKYELEPIRSGQELQHLKDPPGSGGLLNALYQYRRLLTLGDKGFEEHCDHGGQEPFYPPARDDVKPRSYQDLRVDTEVLRTEHAAIPVKWYYSPRDQALLGFEVTVDPHDDPCEVYCADYKPVDGRMLPHRIEVRHGNGRFGVLTVKRYQLAAAK